MKLIFSGVLVFISITQAFTQNTFSVLIAEAETHEPLIGATINIVGTTNGAVSDINGVASIDDLPNGTYKFIISFVGFESKTIQYDLPYAGEFPVRVYLVGGENLESVIVSATRSSRSILDLPTRVEAITSEELDEKAVMNSANISMLLRESTGIMVQQTSANSGNQTLRIQGLDGRYTQLLKDGFPLYGGFSGGLSIMQVPPLDLRQVEVIKGSASTLYGGGAIAGLINLVSKMPRENAPEMSLMLNQTTAGGTTGNVFYSERYKKTGMTVYGSVNRQMPYDPNNDNFSDIPKVKGFSLNPKFFWYPSDKTNAWIGINASTEKRVGGDMDVLKDGITANHTFSEENLSDRFSTQLYLSHRLDADRSFTLRNSISYFSRQIGVPNYLFDGKQWASFSEATYATQSENLDWIVGVNLFTDHFSDPIESSRSYQYVTESVFAQNTWKVDEKLSIESGFRLDHNIDFGFLPLPRISALLKATRSFTFRLGGGLGYKLPTIFNEESEVRSFQGVKAIDRSLVKTEQSKGINFDVSYKGSLGDKVTIQFNQLLFYTHLNNTLILEEESIDVFAFQNADGPVQASGLESNLKLGLDDFSLFLQYSYTDVQLNYENINQQKPLTPKHNLGATLMYEVEDKWRIGYELYYIGHQFRSDYSRTEDYWMMGFMAMRQFKRMSIFINFENFTDTRQSRFQSMFEPPATNPTNTEIWAPTDGFVANAGILIKILNKE
ncbi:MAG: TonB-dependent receptor [Cyclobacteriaceae bacterium]|nr:TonB-dependent receptor [Cyclobacteriaceae bacterium SS2]